jgi:hypothetical protein
LRSRVERRLPALSSLRGHSPAHEDQVACNWEASHVGADLGNDDLGGQVTDTRDGPQQADRVTEKVEITVHFRVDLEDGGIEHINVAQMQAQQEAMPLGDASLQTSAQLLRWRLDAALHERQQLDGSINLAESLVV